MRRTTEILLFTLILATAGMESSACGASPVAKAETLTFRSIVAEPGPHIFYMTYDDQPDKSDPCSICVFEGDQLTCYDASSFEQSTYGKAMTLQAALELTEDELLEQCRAVETEHAGDLSLVLSETYYLGGKLDENSNKVIGENIFDKEPDPEEVASGSVVFYKTVLPATAVANSYVCGFSSSDYNSLWTRCDANVDFSFDRPEDLDLTYN